jgi:hypothetical protein
VLSDDAWSEVCAAAEHAPDEGARTALSTVLYAEYPAFAFDRARVIASQARARRMLRRLDALEEDYRAQPSPDVAQGDMYLWSLNQLWLYADAMWLAACVLRHANARRADVQRAWLYHRLCSVWLNHFHGVELRYSRPSRGGAPYGPLIEFILTAMRQIISKDALPAVETVADAIDRERSDREHFQRQIRQYEHAHGGLTLKK